jgi:hypothetical protein
MEEVVLVLNSWKLDKIFREVLGSGNWSERNANKERIERCSYLVITWNEYKGGKDASIPHGAGYIIGRNLSVVNSEEIDRIVIHFKRYAEIKPPLKDIWPIEPGNQSPVRYKSLEETGIGDLIAGLKWFDFPVPSLR